MSTTNSSTTSNTTEQSTEMSQKRVRFGEIFEHVIPEEEYSEDLWKAGGEMKAAFRADVIAFLTEYKRKHTKNLESGSIPTEEEPEPCCGRGLEMYYPGQLKSRRNMRNMFSKTVLNKSQQFKEHPYNLEPLEAAELLGGFASSLSEISQKKAHALAMQDALEARLVYENVEEETSLFAPLIRREPTTAQTTSKARAA